MTYMRAVVATAATLWLLIEAQGVLEPLLIAVFIWFLLNAMASAWTRLVLRREGRPSRLARAVSAVVFVCVLALLGLLIADNAADFGGRIQGYEDTLGNLLSSAAERIGFSGSFNPGEVLQQMRLSDTALAIAGSAADFVVSVVIVIVYILFLFVEDEVAENKLAAMFTDDTRRGQVAELLAQINREIERYLGVKLILGVVQSVPTWAILAAVGVDGAAFWAVLVFFFSFVPTVGSLVGILFPSAVALLQFDGVQTFLIVFGSLGAVQVTASNWLEPRLMGSTLNLSPIVILVAIFAGGTFWGVVGALIVVPLLAVAVIVLARIPSMRPVAVLLSRDGQIDYGPTLSDGEGGERP